MKQILTILMVLIIYQVKCQDKHLILNIDTLITSVLEDGDYYFYDNLYVTNQSLFVQEPPSEKVGGYLQHIVLKTDSSHLILPLDNNEGYLEIKGLYHSNYDTLHITSYTIYNNCSPDSVRICFTYFKNRTDTLLVNTKKSYCKNSVEEKSCKLKTTNTIHLNINNKKVQIQVNSKSSSYSNYTTGHGYKTSIFGKERNRFHFFEERKTTINTASFTFKS